MASYRMPLPRLIPALGLAAGLASIAAPAVAAPSQALDRVSIWLGGYRADADFDLTLREQQSGLDSGRLDAASRADVLRRLAVCESSDWFWWLGDYNSPQSVACFDRLFRENLKALYRLLNLPISTGLDHPISKGGGEPESGGTMRRAT